MKRLAVWILGVLVAGSLGHAQPDTAWVRIYDDTTQRGDEANAVAVDDSGNVFVGGYSHGVGSDQSLLAIKYRSDGSPAWVRTWNPTAGMDEANAVALDHAHNLILTGFCGGYSGTGGDWATITYGPAGESLWTATYDYGTQDNAHALAIDDSNDVCVVGELGDNLAFKYGTGKYRPTGETLWFRQYSAPGAVTNRALAAALDRQGNILVTGFSTATNRNVTTVKYTPQGDTTWVRSWDGPQHEGACGNAIAADSTGDVFVAGYSRDSSGNDWDLVVKYNANGDTVWARTGGPPGNTNAYVHALAVDRAGNAFVTGQSSTDGGNYWDITSAKLRANGDTAWTARYNATGYGQEVGRAIAVDSAGNAYVAGQSLGNGTGYNAVVLKYDSLGHLLWVARYPGPSNWSDARALVLGPGGTIAVAGKASTPDGYGGALTILYGSSGALEEGQTPAVGRPPFDATVVRGLLQIGSRLTARGSRPMLLDALGRKVLDLRSGPNDVSRLAPGVYFVRAVGRELSAASCHKVVLMR